MQNADLTSFVTQAALREAEAVIEADKTIKLAEASYTRLLALLDNPAAPNARLLAAAKALPKSI